MDLNLPNKLTLLRVIMIPFFLYVLLYQPFGFNISIFVAIAIFILASATDALDGHIARSRNLITNFGKFMDPLADKLLVSSALIALIEMDKLSSIVVIIIISREFIITGFRTVAANNNIVIAASKWGKLKTISQMVMLPICMLGLIYPLAIIENILIIITVTLTIISAVDYIYKNKQVLYETNN